AAEVVQLDGALEALALAGADDVHHLARLEQRAGERLAGLALAHRPAHLAQVALGRDAGLGEMALERLGHELGPDGAEAQLQGLVALAVLAAQGDHGVGPEVEHGDRHALAVGQPRLGHPALGADERVHRQAFTRMSTPAGSVSLLMASTVLDVGSRMWISRLCVRISNCSRDFLSMCGERSTVHLFFTVGNGIGPATRAPVRLAVSTISVVD